MFKKNKKTILVMFVSFVMTMSFSLSCSYAMGIHEYAYNEEILSPLEDSIYYVGEKIPVRVLFSSDTGRVVKRTIVVGEFWRTNLFRHLNMGQEMIVSRTVSTKGVEAGYCWVRAQTFDYLDYDAVRIKLEKLKAPTIKKAKAGKKKVSVSYVKVKGAKKYLIYRSAKKNSRYKKVATTSKTKYIDKKVKKGKKYYYKVKSYRSVHGTVTSNYSSVKRSGKVK